MDQTTIINKQKVTKKWFVIDATNLVLGRMASDISLILRGKKKSDFTPHVDCGDNVIVINAGKVLMTGKKWKQKKYYSHSGYPGGLKVTVAKDVLKQKPIFIVENAVRLMLPKNTLGREMFRHLHVYASAEYKNQAQNPKKYICKIAQKKGLIYNE